MCGIVGAVAERNITAILLEGLKRLEYRGYDSAGVAVYTNAGKLERMRRPGKVSELEQALAAEPLMGRLGIAHTRWATHGAPWVAQRVWAMPRRPINGSAARACSSSLTLPGRRMRSSLPALV